MSTTLLVFQCRGGVECVRAIFEAAGHVGDLAGVPSLDRSVSLLGAQAVAFPRADGLAEGVVVHNTLYTTTRLGLSIIFIRTTGEVAFCQRGSFPGKMSCRLVLLYCIRDEIGDCA
jgi:hypothetical protein